MTYEKWWWEFIAEHEDWRLADSDALRRAAFEFGKASRDAEVTDLLKQNIMLCMYLSQIAWGNTAKQQSAWAEEALNKTQELSKLILCSKDHIAITKNDSEVEFFHIVPQKTLLYRAITDIRKVL